MSAGMSVDAGRRAAEPAWLAELQAGSDVFLSAAGQVVEIAGVGIVLVGAVAASALFLRQLVRRDPFERAFKGYRSNLGRGILLGLEFLVAGDIIGTVAVDPDLRNLAILAAIVLIRTFLSYSIEVEITGRWPWQEGGADPETDGTGRRPERGLG